MKRIHTALGLLAAVLAARAQQISATAQSWPVNLSFADGALGKVPTGWLVPTGLQEKGFSAELRHDGCWSKACVVVLASASPRAAGGTLMQTFSGLLHKGKSFRFRARLRVEARDPNDDAEIWIRVNRANNQVGFFTKTDPPVRTVDWTECGITGRIDDDAESISLGVTLRGKGAAWFDDVSFQILTDPR